MNGVDVIVPCYRYGRFLRTCVSSVLDQQNVAVRVLIIDDCSPDNTADFARLLQEEDERVPSQAKKCRETKRDKIRAELTACDSIT